MPHEPPALISHSIKKLGHTLDVIEFWKENSRIPDIKNYQGLIIMGGPMGVYEGPDVFPSKEEEVVTIKSAHGKIPVIGFCLGSQLLAYAFGGAVEKNIVDGTHVKEVGFYEVELTKDGQADPLLKGFKSPMTVFHLATNNNCTNQAFKLGQSSYGFLFHFEFRPDMVEKLIEVDREWMHKDMDIDEAKLLEETRINEPLMREQCDRLFTNFAGLAQSMQN